ncbi:hypothetical protein J45TS6_36020 [Paenibacillus sp. J45TS6]|uniref:hypothetical protein n=1 Tax=unclassified Paenibacillus TaxID=185978 RepID=UPI001B0DB8F9|nr:hypothetical protein [Paenibacillus sp. J45TS6]GIP45143.1 hypothetical protein J45TS6_36020 [Paenibacillus sp. J45TS6]
MKKLLLLAICSLTLLTACSQKSDLYDSRLEERKLNFTEEISKEINEKINEKEENIKELNQEINQLNIHIKNLNKEKEDISSISKISLDFIQAQITEDKDKLRKLLPEDMIVEKDNEILIDDYYEIFFKDKTLDSFRFHFYDYDSKDNTYTVYIVENYVYLDGESESPPTLLILDFIDNNDRWEINEASFDIL